MARQLRRRKVLMWFTRLMEEVLRDNDFKGGWDNCSNSYLIAKLNEEVDELKAAIWKDLDAQTIIKETADVANIAMMIADNNR